MTITLRPEQEKAITEAIQSGAYQSPDEVLARALAVLRAEDEWLLENRAELQQKIDRAIDQLDQGQGIPGEQLQNRLAQRKAAWLTQPQRG